MLDLAMLARRLRHRGQALLLSGAQPQIRAMIEALGIHKLPGVLDADSATAALPF